MTAILHKLFEVALVRVAPGLLNVISIVLLGRYLDHMAYGRFSTGLATTALAVVLITGPVRFSIVPRLAGFAARGTAQVFERGTLTMLLAAVAVILVPGVLISTLGGAEAAWTALAVSTALFGGWQPVLQARLQFWRFGLASWVNALVILAATWVFVARAPTTEAAVWAYSTGNLLGFLCGWVLCGAPLPGPVDRALLRSMLGVGTTFTLSNLAESGLYLGTRYVVLWFGSPEFLGIFSYAVDIAQRSVGVVINVASFAIVPRAYSFSAGGDSRKFLKYLRRGGGGALVVSLLVLAGMYGLQSFGWLAGLSGMGLSFDLFCVVSVAIVINRLKKMVLDPIAVDANAHLGVLLAYIMVAPFSILISIWCAQNFMESYIAYIYLMSYVFVALLTAAFVFQKRDKRI